ncbi:MAG: hypothetical protein M3P49_01400 [Actinomycetota bacterium]|nr:hypothetical protein [Actinomycetota bacterium]
MKTCRWERIEGEMVRVREDEAALFVDGRFRGLARIDRRGFEHLCEYLSRLEYEHAMEEPASEVFV